MAAWVRKRRVGAASAAELGIHLDDGAHIHHQYKGRAALLRGQSTGVVFCLAARLQQAVAKTLGVAGGLELFRFQHKVVALVAVNAPSAGAAIAMLEGDGPLEHVVLRGRGVGLVHAQQGAQVDDKTLRGRQFTGRYALPTGNKSSGLCGCGNGGGGWFGGRDRHGQR